MSVGFRVLGIAACCGLLMATCGFGPFSSQSPASDVIVTAAPAYDPLAALRGSERFPKGAQLLLIHDGIAHPLLPDFAATADTNISPEGDRVLFAGKKVANSPWQIWELSLADRTVRQVISSGSDAIRPLYLPGWRFVYAQRTQQGFQLRSARLSDSKALEQIEGPEAKPILPLTYINVSAIPADVLADGRHHAALEQDGLAGARSRFDEGEILHAAGADLEDVSVFGDQRHIVFAHHLGDDGEAGLSPRLGEHLQSSEAVTLEGVGRTAGFEGAAAKDLRAVLTDVVSCGEKLVLGLDRTGTGHGNKVAATNFEIQHRHNCLLMFGALQNITGLRKKLLPTCAHPRRSIPGKRQSTAIGTLLPPPKDGGAESATYRTCHCGFSLWACHLSVMDKHDCVAIRGHCY